MEAHKGSQMDPRVNQQFATLEKFEMPVSHVLQTHSNERVVQFWYYTARVFTMHTYTQFKMKKRLFKFIEIC